MIGLFLRREIIDCFIDYRASSEFFMASVKPLKLACGAAVSPKRRSYSYFDMNKRDLPPRVSQPVIF